MSGRILVFDMDGVLVDVTESYREAIQQTVEHFTGRRVTGERIQDYKNQGGWNNDWDLSHHFIKGFGVEAPYGDVVDYFNAIFLGAGGLIHRERWVARDGLLDRLAKRYQLALFTGRLMVEVEVTLGRFARNLRFDPMITADEAAAPKPSPEGLLRIARLNPGKDLWYVGDAVDDARSARQAGVPFIGIAAPMSLRRGELVELFRSENAIAVLDDINQLEGVLPQ
ncbi:MAG: HAD hydrolase-like protein [Bryobacteraceae bacterium]|jgi:HAD superfamily phosphatase